MNELKKQTNQVGRFPMAQIARSVDIANYHEGSIVSREILKKATGGVTLFAFDEGQGLSEHTAPFDAMAFVLEGVAEITISGQAHRLQGGDLIILPANQPHMVKAVARFKMMLVMIRS